MAILTPSNFPNKGHAGLFQHWFLKQRKWNQVVELICLGSLTWSVSSTSSCPDASWTLPPKRDNGCREIVCSLAPGYSWLWEVGGLKLLVDPILVGNLDFGIPWLYDAAKKFLKDFQLDDLPDVDCLLITQRLDDHCHLKTLNPLSQKFPNLRVIATPNAKTLLDPLFSNDLHVLRLQ